jgi:uncharacterized membrane protein YbhN (UPF0104 family)
MLEVLPTVRSATLVSSNFADVNGATAGPVPRARRSVRRLVLATVAYGLAALAFWGIVQKFASLAAGKDALERITVGPVVIVAVAGLIVLASDLEVPRISLPGLRWWQAGVNQSIGATVSNTVPEGGAVATAVNITVLRSWGFRLGEITRSLVVTNVWTNMVRYALAAVALVVLASSPSAPLSIVVLAATFSAVVLGSIILLRQLLHSAAFAHRFGGLLARLQFRVLRMFGRQPHHDLGAEVAVLRQQLLTMVQTRWRALTLAAGASQLAGILTLALALRLEGVDGISWTRIVLAYSGMSLASLIAPTPGGLGVAEGTLLLVLGAGTQPATPPLVAAILLFRAATWLLPTIIGAISYLFWLHSRPGLHLRRRPEPAWLGGQLADFGAEPGGCAPLGAIAPVTPG